MWHVRGRGEVHTKIWWGNLKERNNLLNLVVNGNTKMDFKEMG